MDNQDVSARLVALEKKIDELTASVRFIKKIFIWAGIIMIASFLLPLVGLLFAIPQFLSNYSDLMSI